MLVVVTEQTEFCAGHQDGGVLGTVVEGIIGLEGEFPLVVLYPFVLLLHLVHVCGASYIVGEVLVVFAVPKGIGWGHGD